MTNLKYKPLVIIILCFKLISAQSTVKTKIDQYVSRAQLDSAKAYIHAQLENPLQNSDIELLNYELVKILFMQSAYKDALQQAFVSLDHTKDEGQMVKLNFMTGAIYSAIADYDKSIEYFDLVVNTNSGPSLKVQTFLLLSDLYLGKKDTLKANESLTSAYKITNAFEVDRKIEDHVAMQYHFLNNDFEACKQLNFKTIKDSTSFLSSKSYAYSMIGDCLVKQDSLLVATQYFDQFLELTFETKDPEQIKVAADKLIAVYEKLGEQEKANAYHKIYNEAVNDSMSFSIDKYRDLYEIEKNREIEIAKTQRLKTTIVYTMTILALFSFGIFYIRKNKKLRDAIYKRPGKKIVVSESETKKIKEAIDGLIAQEEYLTPNITRKSFCNDYYIKSERYLSHYINEKYKKSFSVFINDLRIAYAYKRIKNDSKFRNFKIEAIALTSGFGSKKSFERAFLAKYSQTPYKFITSLNA